MVVIADGCCDCIPCVCKLNIPNGVYTLEQVWGKDVGIMEPGCRCCYNTCRSRVAVMVTKNTVRFACPITHIPTKDNVRVSIDVGINFHIGRNDQPKEVYEEDLRKFFYNFGPNRLEELLAQECDEEIRDFMKQIKVSRVRDIKTELTVAM